MVNRGRLFALALAAALGGCAESHEACVGGIEPGAYSLTFTPIDAAQEWCPDSLRDVGELDGSIAPPRCELIDEADDQCGGSYRFRCDTQDATGELVEYEANVSVVWTVDGAAGSGDVVWLDESGAETCAGAYDLAVARL